MKIALVGSAPSSVRLAPYHDPNWRIWGCSPGVYGVAPRTDAWFELHRYEPGQPWFSPEYCQFLAKHPCVWVAEARAEIPNGRALPVEALVRRYGPYFFTSSLSYMFALAIEEILRARAARPAGVHERDAIGLWGVDMAAHDEIYSGQRAGCQFFALLARALQIEVGVPPESDLLRPPPLYGVSELSHDRIKMMCRRRELQARIADAQARATNAGSEITFLQGALDDLTWAENTWTGNVERQSGYVEPPYLPVLDSLVPPGPMVELMPLVSTPAPKPRKTRKKRSKPVLSAVSTERPEPPRADQKA